MAELERREFLIRWSKRFASLALGAALLFAAHSVYGRWRERHLEKQVQQFVTRGEFQSGVLVAHRLLELDQNNVIACTAMAEMAEKADRADAVVWRKKIAHLQPALVAAQIALARTALRFGQIDLTERVLSGVPEASQNNLEYHQVAGAVALAQRQLAPAETHFAAAAALNPGDPHLALNLAIVHLASRSATVADGARVVLADLTNNSAVRLEALRTLTGDALARARQASAQRWAAHLRAEKEASFADVLLCLQAFEATDQAAPILEQLKGKAAPNATTAAQLITWLNRNSMAVVAVHWSAGLAQEVRETQPVPLAIAESYSFMQDWRTLLTFVEGKNWGEYDALRMAVESHALQRLDGSGQLSMQVQRIWHSALEAAKRYPGQRTTIAQLAEGWGYKEAAEEAWWMVASATNNPKAGLAALQRLYSENQDTRGLLRVAKRALELNPNDLVAANNCASLSLLLNPDSSARRLAARLHNEHPTNRAFAATYAFALQTEGKLSDAVKLMQTLSDEELRHPAIAAYYFVMLVESGHLDQARPYLSAAETATLLPEEQQLVSAAARKLLAGDAAAKSVAQSRS